MVVKPLVCQHESKDNELERGIGDHFVHFVCGIVTHELVLLELYDIRSGSYEVSGGSSGARQES
jgi:hypothetical protein